jgi:ATP-binding cassette subfamily B protein
MNTVPRAFAYLRRYPWMALGTLTCAILSTLMVVVFPAVTKRVVDEVLTAHHAERLMPLVLIAALAFLLQNGLNSLRINRSRRCSTNFFTSAQTFA